LGRAKKPLGGAKKPLGRAKKPLGRANKPLGRAKKLLGGAKKLLGRANKPLGRANKVFPMASTNADPESKNAAYHPSYFFRDLRGFWSPTRQLSVHGHDIVLGVDRRNSLGTGSRDGSSSFNSIATNVRSAAQLLFQSGKCGAAASMVLNS
jgi:hypothetical protein